MNKEDIDNLQAGIETDNLVAKHLFGWHKFQTSETRYDALMYPCCDICRK